MTKRRWKHYGRQVETGTWKKHYAIVNNVLHSFKKYCGKAGIKLYCIHDMRRTCITDWAKRLPIHVAKHLAGHRDLRTTLQYYLSVQTEDLNKARDVQESLLGDILDSDPTDPKTDPLRRQYNPTGRAGF